MNLSELINIPTTIMDIREAEKTEVIKFMVEKLAEAHPEIDKDVVTEAVLEREELGSTGIGEGIALPHAKFPFVEDCLVCFARSVSGLNFDSIDNKPVFLVFLVLGPSSGEHQDKYLKLMARTTRLLKQVIIKEELMRAKEQKDVHEIIQRYES